MPQDFTPLLIAKQADITLKPVPTQDFPISQLIQAEVFCMLWSKYHPNDLFATVPQHASNCVWPVRYPLSCHKHREGKN